MPFTVLTHVSQWNNVLDGGQGRTNPFASMRGDKMAMQVIVCWFWMCSEHVVFAQTVNDRFFMFEEIETDAVLSLDEDAPLVSDEVGHI